MVRLRLKNKNGFSLLEALVASLVFVIATAGLLSAFTSQRQSIERSNRRLQAANFAKQVLEDLRAKVDQNTWNTGALQVGNHSVVSADGRYTVDYTVTEDATTQVRKVDLTVSWTAP